jgi:hypothetical protein
MVGTSPPVTEYTKGCVELTNTRIAKAVAYQYLNNQGLGPEIAKQILE